jgi:hypothetical protein
MREPSGSLYAVRAIRATEVFMHRQLFKNSWGQYQMDCSDSAVREVHSLPKSQFNQPSLAGVLERIAAKYKLVVATLQPDKKQGTRREVDQPIDDYGRQITMRVTFVDVAIPFTGDAKSFELAPNACQMIGGDWEIRGQELIVTLPDDQNLQRDIDGFVAIVSSNLDKLRAEAAQAQGNIQRAVENAANQRRAEIADEKERDKSRNFPIS